MNPKKMSFISILMGWFLTAIAILMIALIIVPPVSRSNYFGMKILWAEFLCLLSWGSVVLYSILFSKDDTSSRFGGIAPTISIIIISYSVLSLIAMIGNSYISSNIINRLHLVLQIILFLGAAISIIALSIAREAAVSGHEFNKSKAKTPRELTDILSFCEASISSPIYNEMKLNIKQLKETIQFSLNENAFLSDMPQYQEICAEVQNLSESIANIVECNLNDDAQVRNILDIVKTIKTKVKLVASKSIRR